MEKMKRFEFYPVHVPATNCKYNQCMLQTGTKIIRTVKIEEGDVERV